MAHHRSRAVPLAFLLALGACGGATEGGEGLDVPPVFSSAPSQMVVSASGRLRLAVTWSPETPVKGQNAAQLQLFDDQQRPADGLTVEVVPWMPAHGHGTAIRPTVTSTAPGVFLARPVYLFMSGAWQLRIAIAGALDDSAIATAQIP